MIAVESWIESLVTSLYCRKYLWHFLASENIIPPYPFWLGKSSRGLKKENVVWNWNLQKIYKTSNFESNVQLFCNCNFCRSDHVKTSLEQRNKLFHSFPIPESRELMRTLHVNLLRLLLLRPITLKWILRNMPKRCRISLENQPICLILEWLKFDIVASEYYLYRYWIDDELRKKFLVSPIKRCHFVSQSQPAF